MLQKKIAKKSVVKHSLEKPIILNFEETILFLTWPRPLGPYILCRFWYLKTVLGYYHQKVNMRIATQTTERFKSQKIKKLQETAEMPGIEDE